MIYIRVKRGLGIILLWTKVSYGSLRLGITLGFELELGLRLVQS